MLKKYIKDFLIYSSSMIFANAISFLLIPFYTRVFAPGDYGILDLVTIVTSIVSLTIALEINQAIARILPDTIDDIEKSLYLSTALFFTIIVYSMFAIISIAYADPLSSIIFNSSGKGHIFMIAVLSIWSNGLFMFLQTQLRWCIRPIEYNIVNILFTITSTIVSVFLIWQMEIGVIGVFYGLLAGNILASVLALYFGRKRYRPVFDTNRLKEMLIYSIPLVPSGIGVFITLYIDRILISRLMTLEDLGIYGVAYRFASIIGLLIWGAQMAVTPHIFSNYKKIETPIELAKLFRYFILCSLILFVILGVYANELIILFTTTSYYRAASIIPILTAAIFLAGIYFFTPGPWIVKNTKAIAMINIIAGITNLILNLIMIQPFGIAGSAFSTLISYVLEFYLYIRLNDKTYPIPYPWKKIIVASLVSVFMVGLANIMPFGISLFIELIKIFIVTLSIIFTTLILINVEEIIANINELSRVLIGRAVIELKV